MTRTLCSLALVTIAFSIGLAIYSSSKFSSGEFVTLYASQLLRTTGTALGLALAIAAMVANAQARRWRWFSVYLVLALVTTYGPEFLIWIPIENFSSWFPSFYPPLPFDVVYLPWVVISFCVPPAAIALLVLIEEYSKRVWEMPPGLMEDEADDLESMPLND